MCLCVSACACAQRRPQRVRRVCADLISGIFTLWRLSRHHHRAHPGARARAFVCLCVLSVSRTPEQHHLPHGGKHGGYQKRTRASREDTRSCTRNCPCVYVCVCVIARTPAHASADAAAGRHHKYLCMRTPRCVNVLFGLSSRA